MQWPFEMFRDCGAFRKKQNPTQGRVLQVVGFI